MLAVVASSSVAVANHPREDAEDHPRKNAEDEIDDLEELDDEQRVVSPFCLDLNIS